MGETVDAEQFVLIEQDVRHRSLVELQGQSQRQVELENIGLTDKHHLVAWFLIHLVLLELLGTVLFEELAALLKVAVVQAYVLVVLAEHQLLLKTLQVNGA